MKFIYEYRTSDNVKHNGVVMASDRESAFGRLKMQGIRPGRLIEAPGIANKLFGKGKRWIAIVVLSLLAIVSATRLMMVKKSVTFDADLYAATMRRQIMGDQLFVAKEAFGGWPSVFASEGDRFLASFAIPGGSAGVRTTLEKNILDALKETVEIKDDDRIEVRQIKSIVMGMKDELRRYLDAGGTVAEYCEELVRRQDTEQRYVAQVKNELERARESGVSETELLSLWERKNDELRNMGIGIVQLPD